MKRLWHSLRLLKTEVTHVIFLNKLSQYLIFSITLVDCLIYHPRVFEILMYAALRAGIVMHSADHPLRGPVRNARNMHAPICIFIPY
jgi:hypothetical protein